MAEKILSLAEKKASSRDKTFEELKEEVEAYYLTNDIEEFIILGKVEGGSLRSYRSRGQSNLIWWVGALETEKADIASYINAGACECEEPDKGGKEDE